VADRTTDRVVGRSWQTTGDTACRRPRDRVGDERGL